MFTQQKSSTIMLNYLGHTIHPSTLAVCYEPTWQIFEVRYNGRLWEIVIFLCLTLYKPQKIVTSLFKSFTSHITFSICDEKYVQ